MSTQCTDESMVIRVIPAASRGAGSQLLLMLLLLLAGARGEEAGAAGTGPTQLAQQVRVRGEAIQCVEAAAADAGGGGSAGGTQ